MDPLTAIGLGGNIITFVDVSTKVLSKAKQLYKSASGATSENDELESLTKSLKNLADRTRRKPSNNPNDGRLNITSETVLDTLREQCIQVADELLEMLEAVKVKADGGALKSAIQAVKMVWKQDRIDGIQRRLDRISKQLMDGMSMEQLENINRRLREMAVENTRLEVNRTNEIQQLRQDFNSAIENLKSNAEEEPIPGAWLVLSDTARLGQAYFAEQVILQSLRFSSIESRHESISKEHSNTFSWIFDEHSMTKFPQWLKGEESVYWVSGKPGSGKSTLIKFVAEHERTKIYLTEWAGDKKLVIANFYFWNASTQQSQKSQRGLLRTILYQILRQCPELIQMAYRDQWIALTSDGKVLKESRDELLTVPALLNILRNISTSTASDTKFCFFLDGLDEYDGRPTDIIELVDILKSFQNVKTCVSSRPWNEFEDRFGKDSEWKLYMQDLTRDDIHLYVEDSLSENSRFQQLQKEDPQCPDFVSGIVSEADGVFLWVFLVVRSLLDGLTNSDRIKDLQDRLNETPKDLQEYFRTILFSTENRYRKQTARIFAIAVNTEVELPLMAYWVIDQEDPNYVFNCPTQVLATDVLESRLENMRRRLKVLSKGLLEAAGTNADLYAGSGESDLRMFGFSVLFLHRTVKDYLQTPDAQSMLQSWTDDNFDSDWESCNALGTLVKIAPRNYFTGYGAGGAYAELFCVVLAPRVDKSSMHRTNMASLLDHLQAALTPAFEENKLGLASDFMAGSQNHYLKTENLEADIAILSACVCFGVFNFVVKTFAKEPELCSKVANQVPSLLWSVRRVNHSGRQFEWSPDQEISGMLMLELLLTHGVDPNGLCNGQTEWGIILEELVDEDDFEDHKRLKSFEAIKLLLRYGADFEQQCSCGYNQGVEIKAKASELLREWYDVDQFSVLEDIVKRRDRKGKKKHGISKKLVHLKLWMASKK
jgi:hypothetical protein